MTRSLLSPLRWLSPPLILAAACSGEPEVAEISTAEYGCLHIAEGQLADVSTERSAAVTLSLGRDPYRINMLPDVPGFVALELGAETPVVVLTDFAGTLSAVWRGDEREELPEGAPDPYCDEDIPEHHELTLAAGTNHLELGPVYQGNVWLMIAEP